MKKPIPVELNDEMLDNVSGGTADVGHENCPDFVCWFCGYIKADPAERNHKCNGVYESNYCNSCKHARSCSRAVSYSDLPG